MAEDTTGGSADQDSLIVNLERETVHVLLPDAVALEVELLPGGGIAVRAEEGEPLVIELSSETLEVHK